MGTFGLQLRRAREDRSVRLVDAAKATKIAATDLVAIEYQDFEVLPADEETIVGYVRAYAEYLGLAPEPLVVECEAELAARRPEPTPDEAAQGVEPPPEANAGEAGPRRVKPWVLVAAGSLVVVLALVGWWWLAAGSSGELEVSGETPNGEAVAARAPARVESQEPESNPEPARVDPEPVEADPPPAPPPQPQPSSSRLSVEEHGVGTGVVNRRLVGAGDRFSEGTRVWFWTLVRGGRSEDTIRHIWMRDGRVTNRVPLEVNGPYWRTQSRKTLKPGSRGRWVVEAHDEAGNVLARSEFECVKE